MSKILSMSSALSLSCLRIFLLSMEDAVLNHLENVPTYRMGLIVGVCINRDSWVLEGTSVNLSILYGVIKI